MGKHNRSVMIAVYGTPWAILPRKQYQYIYYQYYGPHPNTLHLCIKIKSVLGSQHVKPHIQFAWFFICPMPCRLLVQ